MHYSGYVEPQDGAMSVLLSFQQEAVVCERRKSRMSQSEQRKNVKCCQNLGKSASKTFQMIKQAYGEEALGRNAVLKWHKCFA
jgi:hypothetical protein